MTDATRFTAIVVNYNGGVMLRECIHSLMADGLPPDQIVVVDNGSQDDSIALLKQEIPACCIVLIGCNAGFARAVNRGMQEVKTEFALLFNNDARLHNGALAILARHFDHYPKAAFAGGQLLHLDGSKQHSVAAFPSMASVLIPKAVLRFFRHVPLPQGNTPRAVETLVGAMFAVRIRAVEAFGLLDEDFFFFLEETEWCYRAHQQGWQVWQVPEAQAVHLQGSTAKRYEALARIEFQRSKLLYFAKTAPRFARLYPVIFGFQAMINAVSNSVIMVLGGVFFSKSRRRTAVYWRVFLWYITGRPSHVGLPGKCPQGRVT